MNQAGNNYMELRSIEVSALMFREPEYENPEEAIRQSSLANAVKESNPAIQYLMGATITSVHFGDEFLRLLTNKGMFLLKIVNLSISVDTAEHQIGEITTLDHERDILLKFSDQEIVKWERARLLEERIGHEIEKIFFGNNCVYIYTDNLPILLVQLLSKGIWNGMPVPLLYWDETD